MTILLATVDDFRLTFESDAPGDDRADAIEAALAAASAQILAAIGIRGLDFQKRPTAGTTTRVVDGPGGSVLMVPTGIIAVASVEVAHGTSLVYRTLGPTDWYLAPLIPDPEEPYDRIVLAESGSLSAWPTGQRRVRVTGVFGYAAVPTIVVRGTAALARQIYRADSTIAGIAGPEEFASGPAIIPHGWPDATYRAIRRYRMKFVSGWMA